MVHPDREPLKNNRITKLNERAYECLSGKKYGEALTLYDQILQIEPENRAALNNKGNALTNLERYDEALLAFDRAIAIDPQSSIAYGCKGYTLNCQGRYSEALTWCDRAIRLEPEDITAYVNKADALKQLGRYEEALDMFRNASALDPAVELIQTSIQELEQGITRIQQKLEVSWFNEKTQLNRQIEDLQRQNGNLQRRSAQLSEENAGLKAQLARASENASEPFAFPQTPQEFLSQFGVTEQSLKQMKKNKRISEIKRLKKGISFLFHPDINDGKGASYLSPTYNSPSAILFRKLNNFLTEMENEISD